MPPQEEASTFVAPLSPQSPVKLGKFKGSVMIVKQSWALLKQDKEILWFPVLSIITSLVALAIMGALFFFYVMGGDVKAFEEGGQEQIPAAVLYAILFGYYAIMFFIVNFFQAGIFIIAHARMNGGDLSFADGIHGSLRVSGKLFVWSLIAATVGVVLQAISDRSKLLGKIVAALLGTAWNILTYFSLPALVIGNVSVKDSFKESAATIRKTWGETFIVNIGVSLVFTMLILGGVLVSLLLMVLSPTAPVFIALAVLMVAYILVLSIVASALSAIFKLALYEYAKTGTLPKGFSADLIHGAVQK